MPSVWSWYQIVEARLTFGYWNVAKPGPHSLAEAELRLAGEEFIPGALGGVTGRDVGRVRQEPSLRVAVALVADTHGAVDVGDHRDRAGVRSGCRVERRARVAARRATRRIGPVERRIDRQEVRQEVSVGIHELVDPLDANRLVRLRLDRERRGVVKMTGPFWAVTAPYPQTVVAGSPAGRICCSNWLDGDLVIVDVLGHLLMHLACPGHGRWDQHGRGELSECSPVASVPPGISATMVFTPPTKWYRNRLVPAAADPARKLRLESFMRHLPRRPPSSHAERSTDFAPGVRPSGCRAQCQRPTESANLLLAGSPRPCLQPHR